MTELYEKSLSKLELGQVLEMLSQCAGSEGGKAACLALMPDSDLDTVRELLDQTTAASDLCARKGNPTFADVADVSASLERADREGTFLLDSVTALLLNELYPDPTTWKLDADAPDRCQKGLETLCNQVQNIVLVSDYIYSDAAKYDEETEVYRRGLARLDRFLAGIADAVIEVSAGSHIFHKGEGEL